MRIHTSANVTPEKVEKFANSLTGVRAYVSRHGSRSRHHALDLTLTGNGRRGGQWGNTDKRSATWDEWGIVLAFIFDLDPDARVPRVYESGEHFRWVTGGRFDSLSAPYQHLTHRWEYDGRSAGGAYHIHACDCGAIQRRLSYGYAWEDIA